VIRPGESAVAVSPLRLGISSCLLGQEVRYDGGHKRDRFLTDVLGDYVTWIPVCPEVEIGLGTPRPKIQLERAENGAVRLAMPTSGEDLTDRMRAYADDRITRLRKHDLAGYVLKKGSPSCGMARVKIRGPTGVLARNGVGTFTAELLRLEPNLPVEEEGRLDDARLRENFITRIFAYRRWKELEQAGPTRRRLLEFHTAHKYLLMSRNQAGMRRLGSLLGQAAQGTSARGTSVQGTSARAVVDEYRTGFTQVMRRAPGRKGHTNVLRNLARHVSGGLDPADRSELAEAIDQYQAELLPLIVPVTLIRHHVTRFQFETLQNQVYLWPHPHELMLLNHV